MDVIVETSYGKIRGQVADGLCVFRGIPFARPPLGERRFLAPEPAEAWAGVRDALRFGAPAPQNASALGPALSVDVGEASEDCLYLNVWTPAADGSRRPVMVWIHGGGFVIGSGSQTIYSGAALAQRGDVVVVTTNYRLGALGFLHLPEQWQGGLGATGNEGLLDQIAALEWVRSEIERFGGDPDNVSVFGESAGSMSIAALLAAPRARGLFRRAILQSGSANFVTTPARARRVAERLLQELGLEMAQAQRLRDVPVPQLLEAQQKTFVALAGQFAGLPFQPVTDGEVIPEHPFATVQSGFARDVALLIGTTRDEMKLFGFTDPKARTLDEAGLLERCERIIPGADAAGASRAKLAIDTYRRARAARRAPTTPPELWFAIDTDRVFRHPALHLADLQRRHRPQTYVYLFTWESPLMNGAFGACHALDLPFVFGTFNDPMIGLFSGNGPDVAALSELIQGAWLAFARGGKPSHERLGDWPSYDPDLRPTMIFGPECGIENAPMEEERRFWAGLR
jgi:para-nitrobenzyl esterase